MLEGLKRLFGLRSTLTAEQILKYPEGKRIYREFHSIRASFIDPDAVKVVNRIQQFGYRAFIVGGCVRDLLIGRQPKDYDIVTNAHPAEVKRMFANSRVIGRRFRIVHVVFRGNKIIEVSTARSLPKSRFLARKKDELLVKRDNEFGSFKDDAARRDFTINSLFFDLRNETIIDYLGGYEDIKERIVRIVGDEDVSLPEDPVRMLRAVKFSALLDFELHPRLLKGLRKYRKLIKKASQARLHEEYNKIFRTANSVKVFSRMVSTGLFEASFPEIAEAVGIDSDTSEVEFLETLPGKRLEIADRMISEHEDINTTIYYALICADLVLPLVETDQNAQDRNLEKKIKERIEPAEKELGLTRKESDRLVQVFTYQNYFLRDVSERKGWVKEFQSKPYFLEAFIFFKINTRAMENEENLQKALFWEIGLREKLPQAIRKVFHRPLGEHPVYHTERNNSYARQGGPHRNNYKPNRQAQSSHSHGNRNVHNADKPLRAEPNDKQNSPSDGEPSNASSTERKSGKNRNFHRRRRKQRPRSGNPEGNSPESPSSGE